MSQGQIEIGIPGSGTTDFAAGPIPSVTLDDWDLDEGIPVPRPIGYKEIGQRSNNGVAGITGPAHEVLYGSQIVVFADINQMLQVGALAEWQKDQQDADQLGALRYIDECNYLPAKASPHPKQLLTAFNPTWNAAYEYGYGVLPVQLILSDGWNRPVGQFSDGTPAYRLTFDVEEI
ncbi:MAG: hypothetical protein AAGD09_11610 [Cyanobacteria bacterium P01_F01_bin.56]